MNIAANVGNQSTYAVRQDGTLASRKAAGMGAGESVAPTMVADSYKSSAAKSVNAAATAVGSKLDSVLPYDKTPIPVKVVVGGGFLVGAGAVFGAASLYDFLRDKLQ